jgi:predicted GIY-YIG superfamily endonuclease
MSVYILELLNNNWYVGYTENYTNRMNAHFNKEGAEWTKLHKPIRTLMIIPGDKQTEREVTLNYMKQYGWQRVRGDPWTRVNMKNQPEELKQYNLSILGIVLLNHLH